MLLGLVCVALLRESIVADPIASNDEEEWEFTRAKSEACLFWLFCGFWSVSNLLVSLARAILLAAVFMPCKHIEVCSARTVAFHRGSGNHCHHPIVLVEELFS